MSYCPNCDVCPKCKRPNGETQFNSIRDSLKDVNNAIVDLDIDGVHTEIDNNRYVGLLRKRKNLYTLLMNKQKAARERAWLQRMSRR